MAKIVVHTEPPSNQNELSFVKKILVLDFPNVDQPHIWYAKIPGTRDVDAILWVPRIDLFVVEMKSWGLSAIKTISTRNFEVEESVKHSTIKSPWEQALDAKDQISNRLTNDTDTKAALGNPWITPVVALFNMRRSEFERRFSGATGVKSEDEFKRLLSGSTIFDEDLISGSQLLERLRIARQNPVYRQKPSLFVRSVNYDEALRYLNAFVSPLLHATRAPLAYDRERVKQLEEQASEHLKAIQFGKPAICTGYAGTGKTLSGLKAALHILLQTGTNRKSGLFVCFNKVLATDIRRLIALSPKYREVSFDIFDVFGLVRFLASRCQVSTAVDETADKWGERIVKDLLSGTNQATQSLLQSWDFVVVDESQDLQDWAWDLIDRLSDSRRRLFAIDGKRQLLYRSNKATFLELLHEEVKCDVPKSNFIEQRRVFRTTDTTFLISQLFMETFPDAKEAQKFWDKQLKPAYDAALQKQRSKPVKAQLTLPLDIEFPRHGGFAPKLIPVKSSSSEELAKIVTKLIQEAYEKSKRYFNDEQPSSILILVPNASRQMQNSGISIDWAAIARDACKNMGLRFIDYTDEGQRRHAYSGDEVRICTFHSSRGIEGLHSIVLGFDSLSEAAQNSSESNWRVGNLGYITLSRSMYDTDVVYLDSPLGDRQEIKFLKEIIEIVGN